MMKRRRVDLLRLKCDNCLSTLSHRTDELRLSRHVNDRICELHRWCPVCEEFKTNDIKRSESYLLEVTGVKLVIWTDPVLSTRPESPLTHDDAIDFHRLLREEDDLIKILERLDPV